MLLSEGHRPLARDDPASSKNVQAPVRYTDLAIIEWVLVSNVANPINLRHRLTSEVSGLSCKSPFKAEIVFRRDFPSLNNFFKHKYIVWYRLKVGLLTSQ